jgi:hypothetical protein
LDYDNAIKEAQLQNNSVLAEIAAQALEKRLEAIISFTQQNNSLLTQKADAAYKIKQTTQSNYMDVLKEIENQRQFDLSLAEQKRQHDEEMAYKYASSTTGSYSYTGGTFTDTVNGGYTQDSDGRIVEEDNFTGTTYKEACAYLRMYGADSNGLLTQSEWQRHKNNPNNNNAHTNYDNYEEYLKDYVAYATGN